MSNNHITPLNIVIDRVGFSDVSKGGYFFADEVKLWPKDIFESLLSAKILQQATHHKELTTCDNCEKACTMPVTIYPAQPAKPGRAFITCDKRDDAGRIPVDLASLNQWHSSIENFVAVLPKQLQTIMAPDVPRCENGKWPLGLLKGKNGLIPIALTVMQEQGLALLVGNNSISLKQVLRFNNNGLSADHSLIKSIVDEATQKETPEARRERLQNQINVYKAQGRKDFFAQTAKDEGITSQRLRAIIDAKNEDATLVGPAKLLKGRWLRSFS